MLVDKITIPSVSLSTIKRWCLGKNWPLHWWWMLRDGNKFYNFVPDQCPALWRQTITDVAMVMRCVIADCTENAMRCNQFDSPYLGVLSRQRCPCSEIWSRLHIQARCPGLHHLQAFLPWHPLNPRYLLLRQKIQILHFLQIAFSKIITISDRGPSPMATWVSHIAAGVVTGH